MKKIKIAFFGLMLFLSSAAFAQNPGDPGEDPDVPIDGGAALLVAAGVAVGVKKIRQKKNQKEN